MKTLISILVFLVVVAAAPGVARACSCLAETGETEAERVASASAKADAVFVGEVVRVTRRKGELMLAVEFKVSYAWKGVTSPRVVVYTATSSAACGIQFQEKLKYVVYANGEARLSANSCSRTGLLGSGTGVPDEQYLGLPGYLAPRKK